MSENELVELFECVCSAVVDGRDPWAAVVAAGLNRRSGVNFGSVQRMADAVWSATCEVSREYAY